MFQVLVQLSSVQFDSCDANEALNEASDRHGDAAAVERAICFDGAANADATPN